MLRLFRSISRGRRNNNTRNKDVDEPWDASSPEPTRHRAVGNSVVDDDEDHERDGYSPRHQGPDGYFDQRHADEYEDIDDEDEDEDNEDEDAVGTPLLPIFSAAHLDRLPLYNITHAIRLLIVQRCETTLSWDQLRSPQVSQFLVKPVQGQIRADHFNRATLCALLANCLQFQKEGQMQPGNVGVSRTRAMVAELLAMRLLREFSTRELIDSLSYDFDPLQGMTTTPNGVPTPGPGTVNRELQVRRAQGRFARVSTIEIAIRAEAKRFLAHPLVVQHLEAIWAGNIVFHSEADNLHRKHRRSRSEQQSRGRTLRYGTTAALSPSELPANNMLSRKGDLSKQTREPSETPAARRTVTLYNPKDASLFKLSRLRVPRYRQIFSTLSFATMLVLFILVLVDRSIEITALEVLFWFWSTGYMLDELVGFTEQGFGLYIMSFWNAFDLGILCLFGIYYVLRLYGLILVDSGKHRVAGIAYDVLASTAVLLFPRLFSVLDHYRYFSQLLIAFRMMALDLMAVLVLIVISCSGFFVALSLSFAEEGTDAGSVVYSLFQILMGFTPAVWDHWANYNILGRAIMAIFLTLCHFLIVTILITVLTNSFMAIVKNAEEEHQFLFAVNAISMVKSDALFSYIPPTNIIGWLLSPVRYMIPLRRFVKFNRTIIKITHVPILFAIFLYERVMMSRSVYAPLELIERQPTDHRQPAAFTSNKARDPYSSTAHRLREPSVISFNKDRALDEVFRRPFRGDTVRTTTREMELDKRESNAVDQWMQEADNEGGASPPLEEHRSVLERLENRRPKFMRANTSERIRMLAKPSREFSTATRSVASESGMRRRPQRIAEESEPETTIGTMPHDTEGDGDDESNAGTPGIGESALSLVRTPGDESETEFFHTPMTTSSPAMHLSHAAKARLQYSPEIKRGGLQSRMPRRHHDRQTSNGTILFAPQINYDSSVSQQKQPSRALSAKRGSGELRTSTDMPVPHLLVPGTQSPKRRPPQQVKPRPIISQRQQTEPNMLKFGGLSFLDQPRPRQTSFNARALDLASEIGDNKFGPSGIDAGGISGMPASFSEQMMRDRDLRRLAEEERRRSEEEEKGMVNRIMLARMHTLEEGFREVLKGIKDLSQTATSGSRRDSEVDSGEHLGVRRKTKPEAPSTLGRQTLKTPIGRIGGNDKSKKGSPRKFGPVRSGKKNKENATPPNSSGRDAAEVTATNSAVDSPEALDNYAREQAGDGIESPESVKSVLAIVEAGEGASGPPTTFGRPSTVIQDDELVDIGRQRDE